MYGNKNKFVLASQFKLDYIKVWCELEGADCIIYTSLVQQCNNLCLIPDLIH